MFKKKSLSYTRDVSESFSPLLFFLFVTCRQSESLNRFFFGLFAPVFFAAGADGLWGIPANGFDGR